MKLYTHQNEILKSDDKRKILAWSTSAGKTLAAIKLVEKYEQNTLFITPKSLYTKWVEVAGGLDGEHHVITKERIRDSLDDVIKTCKEKNINMLIIDESHAFAGIKSQLTKGLKRLNSIIDFEYRYFLTATPYTSTAWNLYTLIHHLGYTMNYIHFRNKFMVKINMGMRTIWKDKTDKKTRELLHTVTEQFIHWVTEDDVVRENNIHLHGQTERVVYFNETEEIRKAKSEIQEIGIARWTKEHLIENGVGDEGVYIKNEKVDYILKRIKEKKKIAIIARYTEQIEHLEKLLKKRAYNVYTITGKTKDVYTLTEELDKVDEAVVIIQAQISEGYELPSFEYVIYASLSFSYKDFYQMKGRFMRLNNVQPTHSEILITKNGVDPLVLKAVRNKQRFYDVVKKEKGKEII